MKRRLSLVLVAGATLLSACQGGSVPEPGPEMGNAVPAPSPASAPEGEVVQAGVDFLDLVVVDDVIAARSADTLLIGGVEEFRSGSFTVTDVDAECGDLAASEGFFLLACGEEILQIPAQDPARVEVWSTQAPARTAVWVDGRIFAGNPEDAELMVYSREGKPETMAMAHPVDQLVSTPREGKPDSIVSINRANTTIQDVDLANERQGGTLRVGVGVAQAAAGEDGLVVVADALAPEIAIYTTDDVVRLQQIAPTDPSPWGAAWDPAQDRAWVSSTSENRASGYDISDGVPLRTHEIDTVADARHIAFLSDGTFLAASATGEGLQIVTEPTGL